MDDVPGGVVPPEGLPPRGCAAGELVRALWAAGIEHKLGTRGPVTFDCYAMMQLIQWHLFSRDVMSVWLAQDPSRAAVVKAVNTHPARRSWRLNKGRPQHGDAVTMSHVREPFHIGTFLDVDRGVIVHCADGMGLAVDDNAGLIAGGWRNLRYYSYVGDET